ncbi:23976_t:CDS:2 [Gigaspora margarita]|uniref:23976_t:CDS:1 n=1 Tax=Gigaspora margarita TaxID=4874 RepID=A0ABN7UUJ5_GIGMA|nr:23976_t:CDS:2 [Gigaspora margarita]
MFSERNIWLCNPSLVDKLFTNSTKTNFFCRALSTNGFKELGMDKVGIVFNRDFDSWKYNRRILNYTLTNVKVLKGYMEAVKKLFIEIEDFSQWMRRFITDLALNMNFGDHAFSMAGYFNSLSKYKKNPTHEIIESEKFIKMIFMTFCPSNFIRRYVPPLCFFHLRFQWNYNWLTNEFSRIIQKRTQEIENVSLDKLNTHDVLDTLLTVNKAQDLKGSNGKAIKPMDEREIFGVLLEFFVAGVETVETSRLKTNPPINPRELYEQDEIGGYIIPKGSTVIACADAIHLHKNYWENPNEFIPERFLSNDYPLSMSQKLFTFGGGLRGCVGKQLAMLEMKTILVLLFRKYDVDLLNHNVDAKDKTYLLNSCNSLMVRFKIRKEE